MKSARTINNVHINHIYLIALIICLAYFGASLMFIRYTGALNQSETIGYIQNAIQQTKFALKQHIQDEFDTLRVAAVVAQGRNLLIDDEVLRALVNGLGAHNDYLTIGFADISGQALWIDRYNREYRANLSGEGFIERALSGEVSLSEAYYNETSGQNVHYYAVPIYDRKTNAVEGVLFAADPQDEFRNIVDHSLYAGKGLSHIIDSEGNYIVQSESPLALGIGTSIFDLQTPLKRTIEQEIRNDLSARNAGYLVKAFYGENRLIAYAPLDINDWNVFYAVPENLVSAGLKNIMSGAIAVVGIATAVFIFFIALIHTINNKSQKAMESLAFVDPVTGHRSFHKFILDSEKILEETKDIHYAVCFTSIKDFQYINDLYGRDVGDRLLRYLADFQQTISQEGEISCRICEHTFVALRRYQSKNEIELRFESAAQHLAVFPETFSRGYKPELYGGVYLLDTTDGSLTLNDMLDRAVSAHESAKSSGGIRRFDFYSKEMRDENLWKTELESKMEEALENGEFQMYLQPKIDIQHGDRICGAEALVRWASPEKGLIPPGRFIDLFEKNGFILKLDRFIFDRACRYYKENFLDGGMANFVLSVNISRLALMRPDFICSYIEIKQGYGIPDGCIELEFTENLVFGDESLFKDVINNCKRNGFLCSMDDFGSGYSSLNMLKSIYMDVLKLDRQFFLQGHDVDRGWKLVKSIIAMAKSLNMKTVAEGVDEQSQIDRLRATGCDIIQGYVFAQPMPAEVFKKFVESWPDQ